MSWTFSMNCGSLDSFHVSWRWGCNPNACQIRSTASAVTPACLAIDRVDQCVAFFGLVSNVVITTLESAPKDATHWSTRSMAREVGMTPDAVMRIWHAFGLQPHRREKWKLSKDPQFIEKVHDICGLYLNPPERAVVLCVDEKSQIQGVNTKRDEELE